MEPELDETLPASSDRTATKAGAPTPLPVAGLPAGRQLGHFRIERPLGAGGMGEVYLATDLALDRPVAIKVLPEIVARDPKRRDRMIREARAQARITHPNVGHIYFIGEDGDRLYFAMEYVAGKTIAERIAEKPLTVDEAIAVIRAAALGLREAQRSGFTHRDVKPSNLMIDAHGVLKVLDFGLAAGGQNGEMSGAIVGPVAQTSLAGTPLYMAPEQARGEAVDFRSDIYALGATLFHLVAGKPPFEADSVDKLISMHATAARPGVARRGLRRIQIGQLDALCSRMMAAKPEDRFASYDELLLALDLASLVQTRPGGFWARSLAMTLDFMIVAILMVLVEAAFGSFDDNRIDASDLFTLPILAMYQALAIARWGTTLGKSVVELEVVDVQTGTRPTFVRALARQLTMFAIPIIADTIRLVAEQFWDARYLKSLSQSAGALTLLLGIALLVYASLRIANKRAVWDRVSRTMVRYRTTRASLAE